MKVITVIVILLLISIALFKAGEYANEKIQEINEKLERLNEKLEKLNVWMQEINKTTTEKKETMAKKSKEKPISAEINISSEMLEELTKKADVWSFETKDSHYFSASLAEIEKIVEEAAINEMEYINQTRDCDDFSLMLASYFSKNYNPHPAIGIVYGTCNESNKTSGHNWNSVLVIEIYYIEPQTGKIFSPEEYEKEENCTAREITWY